MGLTLADFSLSGAGGVLLLCVSLRTWLVFGFNRMYPHKPDRWLMWFRLLTLLLAGTWGLFCAHAVLHYGPGWTDMLTLLSTAGISAGAITTLSIHRNLIMPYLGLLLLPPTVAAALLNSRESFAIMLMFLVYSAFMFNVAKNIYREYWKALDNTGRR